MSSSSSLFGYTGEQFDGETGFTFLRARYLNPAVGRFTSVDTVQPNAPGTQGYNVYAYVANNPTNWVDPSGHMTREDQLLILRIATAAAIATPFLPTLYANCRAASTAGGPGGNVAGGYCVAGLAVLVFYVFACAMAPVCFDGAWSMALDIMKYGSTDIGGTIDFSEVGDAIDEWPEEAADAVETFADRVLNKCLYMFEICDAFNWTGNCGDCLDNCRAQGGDWPLGWCHPRNMTWAKWRGSMLLMPSPLATKYGATSAYPMTSLGFGQCVSKRRHL